MSRFRRGLLLLHTFCSPFLHLHLGNPISPSKADLDGYKYEKIGYKDIFTACIICWMRCALLLLLRSTRPRLQIDLLSTFHKTAWLRTRDTVNTIDIWPDSSHCRMTAHSPTIKGSSRSTCVWETRNQIVGFSLCPLWLLEVLPLSPCDESHADKNA